MIGDKTPNGVSKVDRYNWTVQDAPGSLMLIHKNRHAAYWGGR